MLIYSQTGTAHSAGSGLGSRSLQGDADEYIDQEDAGYTREYIKGQAAFEAKELHPSVHDSSRNAMQLYRQAKASQNASHLLTSERMPPMTMLFGMIRSAAI